MVERLNGIQKVRSSTLLTSTIKKETKKRPGPRPGLFCCPDPTRGEWKLGLFSTKTPKERKGLGTSPFGLRPHYRAHPLRYCAILEDRTSFHGVSPSPRRGAPESPASPVGASQWPSVKFSAKTQGEARIASGSFGRSAAPPLTAPAALRFALNRLSSLFGTVKWRVSATSPKHGVRSPPCSLRPSGRTCALRARTARPCAVLCVLGVLSRGRFGPLGLHGNFQKHTGSPSLCCSVYPSVNLCDLQTHWQSCVR